MDERPMTAFSPFNEGNPFQKALKFIYGREVVFEVYFGMTLRPKPS